MDRIQAANILNLCSKPEWKVLEGYLYESLATFHVELESYPIERLAYIQGQCQMLRFILNLQNEALNVVNHK